MARRPTPLPAPLASAPFRVSTADEHGVKRGRLRARDLEAPYHGSRTAEAPASHLDRAAVYAVRMPDHHAFAGLTAAIIYSAPVPMRPAEVQPLHVSGHTDKGLPRCSGVRGIRRRAKQVVRVQGAKALRVSSPADAWCELVGILSHEDLVAVGDFFVTGRQPVDDDDEPLATIAELEAAVDARSRSNGVMQLRAALRDIRYGAVSRMETRTRLVIVSGGLPEPELNHRVYDNERKLVAIVDLAYPGFKVAVEYEGEHHFEPVQGRKDIERREKLADLGWTTVQVTSKDVFDTPEQTVERIRARLRSRGANV
ncbi:endonuclease domain-containing protein [Agromyces mangrovi Wang et al. 2018]|uniref:endonuclease domain-containing protein n=1 Tax=Agromyces mangrovi TaxID=1858653 RepID=UPI002572780E|nr:DUF559 domain-containing protein [Agromyces mangrovi]BDZ63566.1 hypothetical protein GCM10025877_05040 [Agromyces mangrovi]